MSKFVQKIIDNEILIKCLIKKIPQCNNCIHFINKKSENTCKIFENIYIARTNEDYCGIDGKYFKNANYLSWT